MDYREIVEKIKKQKEKLLTKTISTERDKKVLALGAACLVLFILFFVYQSYSSKVAQYEKKQEALREELVKVKTLTKDYSESRKRLQTLTSSIKKEDEALISVLEKILVDNNIDRQDFSIKDSNSRGNNDTEDLYEVTSVQVDIRRVPLYKIIDVLYKIQTRKSFLKVSDLQMKTKFDKPELVDASFKLSTYDFKKVI